MSLPTRRPETIQIPLSLPFGQQVYTHPMPDTQTCRSFWSQPTCTCGTYALTWESKAVAWSGFGSRALDLTLVPDNQGVIAILAAAIDGPYRFVHHALNPHVKVWPAFVDEPITVRATRRLSLQGKAPYRQLQGTGTVMTLAVILDHPEERLMEVGAREIRAHRHPPLSKVMGTVPIAEPAAVVKPVPRKMSLKRLEVAAEPPPAVDAQIPEIIADICRREDVHPDLGDYLVIPESSVPTGDPLPPWVVRYDVEQIRLVKPRLGVDRPVGGEGEA